jgi:hypothetical protein
MSGATSFTPENAKNFAFLPANGMPRQLRFEKTVNRCG